MTAKESMHHLLNRNPNIVHLGEDYKEVYAELIATKYYLDWIYSPKNRDKCNESTSLIAFLIAHNAM